MSRPLTRLARLAGFAAPLALALAACSEPVALDPARETPPPSVDLLRQAGLIEQPETPWAALEPFYGQLEYDAPRAPAGPTLPGADRALTSIAFGSCNTAEREIPILNVIADAGHELFIYAGDNVYGDARAYDATLPELRTAYHQLAARPEFQRLRAAVPMLAVWDDHDYGMNDMGRDFAFKGFAERLFLDFWGAGEDDVRRTREGIYDAHVFGPEGQRVQVILLDTRWFRSDLTPTDERGAVGRERYIPSPDPDQDMLGAAQWAWLEAQLQVPAQVRLIVSSIQVHADGHGWEAWRTMPRERDRLYGLIRETGANGVVLVSGDRHSAGLYVREDVIGYPLYEITSSSLNMSYRDVNDEPGPHRIGDMFAPENYGVIGIDWEAGALNLEIRDNTGAVVREQAVALSQIGALR
ncbi:MAG: alkaline phosphatase family protein [Alphaproteobacteria bacterium]|nr:alkaline phosphatase family protein [Alphaproteobacteria bacterium]